MNLFGVMKLLGTILGTYAAFCFLYADWHPLPEFTPNWEIGNGRDVAPAFGYIADPAKREFFIHLYETFESENPGSEIPDVMVETRISQDESEQQYQKFDQVLFAIRTGNCPIKEVVVPSKWDDARGIDRRFHVFDIKNCK